MHDARVAKALELRSLAEQFRARTRETQLLHYIELMLRSAAELDSLADAIEMQDNSAAVQKTHA